MSDRYPILSVLTIQQADSFWFKVLAADSQDCWLWQGTKMKKGYGGYPVAKNGTYRMYCASRVAYALHYGVDPESLDVLHKCDNPLCCNPEHLFLGTNQDNIADRVRKGRSASGEKHWSKRQPEQTSKGQQHGRSKLKDDEVLAIRRHCSQDNVSRKALAGKFNVSVTTINLIVARKIWKHI